MAKSKSFFGLRTGSTKSLTFQVYRGQQITKDRVTRISNPRSEAQMRQRAIIPIVAASRAALKGLVDHSFEGVPYGEQSLKKFSELNLRAGAIDVKSYSPNGVSNPGFASLKLSSGSLSDGGVNISVSNDHTFAQYVLSLNPFKDLIFKAAKAGDSAEAVLKTIAEWGATECEVVAPGSQLTFLTASLVDYVMVGNNKAPLSGFDICRVLFPSTGSNPAQVDDVNGSWKVETTVAEGDHSAKLTDGNHVVHFAWVKGGGDGGEFYINVKPLNQQIKNVCGCAIIRSAYVNNVWKRSNAQIVVSMPENVDRYTYEQWRSYYESTGVSAKYLNQGGESTAIQG